MRTLFLFIGCLFAVWCFAITDAYCTEDFWERDTLIMGGSPSSLSIAYDSRVMLALHTGTAYLSTDYGDIWQRLNFPARVIAVSASYSEYIYIATTDSLYYSVDLGRTWKTLAVPFVTNKFYSDIDNRWRKNTYASLCSVYPQQISIFINTTLRYEPQDSLTTSIYSTNNNGATWDSLMFLPLFTPKITFNKDYGTALLTGWRFGKQTMSGIQGIVMCSKDSAKTWQLLTDTLPSYLGSAIMLDKNIYMTTVQEKGIFKSIDSGNTWKSVSSPVQTVWSLAWHKGQLLAGTAENLYISSDTGRTWIISDATPKIFSLASIISNHDAVFILSYTGVFRDKAFPSVFEDIDKQFIAGSIRSASWFDRSTMLVCYNGGASITTDMGKSWRKTGLVSYFVSLVGISSKKTLFVATSNRFDNQLSNKITSFFMRSTDNGATWHEVYGIKSNGNTYPIYPDCFLAVGDTIFAGEGGILRSTDDGQTWRAMQGGSAMCLYRTRAGTYLAGDEGAISRSTDGGATFKPTDINTTLTSFIFFTDIVQNPKTGRLFAASTGFCNFGIYYSDDDGEIWIPHTQWLDRCTQKLAVDSIGNIYATSWYDIFRSTDNGATWQLFTSSGLAANIGNSYGGLSGGSPYSAFIVSPDGRLYLGMQDGGLYRSTERFPPVGVSEQPAIPDDASLQIIPNPAGESFRVVYSGGGTVTVRDVLGRVVLSGVAGDMFSTAGLAAGAYSVEVYPDNKSKRLSAIMMLRR